MARVTVEDCLKKVPNRFDMVLLASKRAHQLNSGQAKPGVPWDSHKPTVIALREIAGGMVTLANIETFEEYTNLGVSSHHHF